MRILICLLFSIVAVDFAAAACKINLRVKNETKHAIRIQGYEVEEDSKDQRYLSFSSGLPQALSKKTRYFPGSKEWTESRNVTIPIKSCK